MSEETKKAPVMRFQGFSDDWEQRKFKDVIISIQTGTNLLGAESNHGTPLIKMGNIQRGFFSFKKVEFLNENEQVEEKNMINFGDFLFNTRNTLDLVGKGATWFGKNDEYAFNSNIARFTFEGINTIFFNYLYNTPQMIKQVQARAVGTTSVAAVYPKDLNSIKFWIPSANEQQKIGALFKQIDDTITLHQRKLTLLKQLKQTYIQALFPQSEMNIPTLRFAGFSDPWEQRKVSSLAKETYGGGTPRTGVKKYWNGSAPWIQSSDLSINQLHNVQPTKFITEEAIKQSATHNVPDNSIAIVTRVGVGKLALMPYSYSTSQDFLSLSNLNIDAVFGVYCLYKMLQREVNNIQGTSIKGITKADLLEKYVSIPTKVEEQVKIGAFFKKIDDTIDFHESKLKHILELKKAFLEKMFL